LDADFGKEKKASAHKNLKKQKALLLGLGLDSKDGHIRVTRGPNFQLLGGSYETHEVMQESAVKFNEELIRRGKRLEEVGPQEFLEIFHKVR